MVNDEQLHKWVNGTLNAEELASFKQRPDYESLVELYKHTAHLSAPSFDEDAMLADILQTEKKQTPPLVEEKPPQEGRRVFLSSWIKYGVAASVLLLAAWFFWPSAESMVEYQLAKGERKEGLLPDQSSFVLNAESTLAYDANNWDTNRILNLKGEAFFKVKKGSTFKVKTPNGTVQVLGTQFNVWSRKDVLEVSCKSGKVAVLSSEGKVLEELNPNNAVRITANTVRKKWELLPTNQVNWMNGIFRFKAVPLATVLEELERQFDIKIDASEIDSNEELTCNFQGKDLDAALKTTLMPLGIQYEMKGAKNVRLFK